MHSLLSTGSTFGLYFRLFASWAINTAGAYLVLCLVSIAILINQLDPYLVDAKDLTEIVQGVTRMKAVVIVAALYGAAVMSITNYYRNQYRPSGIGPAGRTVSKEEAERFKK
ncbi:TPA: hypothetical protein ACUUEN_005524 [Pseudomonas aeruginosa]